MRYIPIVLKANVDYHVVYTYRVIMLQDDVG